MNKRELTKTIISELREDNEIKNLKFKVKQEEFLGAFCPCAFEIETATGIFRAEVEETFVSLSFEKENSRECFAFYDIPDDFITYNLPIFRGRELSCDKGILKDGRGIVVLGGEDKFNWSITNLVITKIKNIIKTPNSVKFIERL